MTLNKVEVSIIVPKEATNLVTNPSFEVDTTGYTAIGAGVSIARSTSYMRRGIASCEVTTATGVVSGMTYSLAVTNGIQYSFSIDVRDVAGQTFVLYVLNQAGNVTIATTTWTGTGQWKRRYVTFTAAASENYKFEIIRGAIASTTKFYTDGWQVEVGAVSTYLDGNMSGFVNGQTAYRWNGLTNASTSWRSGQTRSGGTFVKISDYARLLHPIGLGMAELTNIGVPSTMGGSFYQTTIANERPFSIVINVRGSGDYAVTQRNKSALINALKPDVTTLRQPLLLQVDELDATNLEVAETLMIPAVYDGGLEMDGSGDSYNEKVALNFRMFVPLIQQDGEKGTALGFQSTVANANYILKRGADGVWAAMGTGGNSTVFALAVGPDGSLYAGGLFTLMGGVANTAYVARWNGSAWSALGTGMNGSVRALAVGPDGSLYAGGEFTLASGVANTAYVAKWNGSAWSALGTGANDTVFALAVGPDGSLYAGGQFTLMGGVANTARIAKWNGAAWSALGTGANGTVAALAIGPDGSLYAGGYFTLASGVANTAYVAKWNGAAWSALGTGGNNPVFALAVGPDGSLYAGGQFTLMGGIANTARIAKWNGAAWSALGTGANDYINALAVGPDGLLYAGGAFTSISGITPPDGTAIWTGSTWVPIDVDLPGTSLTATLLVKSNGELYVGFATSGSATSATVTVPNIGSATAYPKVIFTGPGTTYQFRNYTPGKAIYFNLTLNAGEVATLNLDPMHIAFNSTFRGNILNTILPGSDLSLELLPGANNVSAFMYGGTTAASGIAMTWRDQYWSLDGAVR